MIAKFFFRMFEMSRLSKIVLLVGIDAGLLTLCFALAMYLRLDHLRFVTQASAWAAFAVTLPVTIAGLLWLSFYKTVVRHIGGEALLNLAVSIVGSALLMLIAGRVMGTFLPRSVPFIYAPIAFLALGGARFALRTAHQRHLGREKARVLIYGAGSAGRQLLVSLHRGSEYAPVAFVDDAAELQGRVIEGCRVHDPARLEHMVRDLGVEAILLAIPSATRARRRAILDRLEPLAVRVQTVPGMSDIVSGRAMVGEVRKVSIEDLLGRDPVPPLPDLIAADIRGKVVMVTGAGGSIGSELCRQIVHHDPRRLVLLDLSELALYTIDQDLKSILTREKLGIKIVPILGSVRNPALVRHVLAQFGVETIYHAAAYKHVPLVEYNVVEGVLNNVFGTLVLARAAADAGVSSFVLISTDKAVRPTNVMGTTKRLAELVCQALPALGTGTCFSMVRFGNVLGSSGSVIPLFRRQIEAGGPITVTHPDVTRYFMTIPEAAQLVLQAGAMGRGGDVFVLDMGEPVRIVDLAVRMARLSGLKSTIVAEDGPRQEEADIEITFSSLRPGEKLYEELLIGDDCSPTKHPRISTAVEASLPWAALSPMLDELQAACDAYDVERILVLLARMPTGYTGTREIVDLVWSARGPRLYDTPVASPSVEAPIERFAREITFS